MGEFPEEKERLKGTQGQDKSSEMSDNNMCENKCLTGKSPAISTNCKEEKKVKLTCLLFAGLNALLFLLLILTIIYMTKDLSIEIEQTAELCVNCAYLEIHPDDELTGVSRRDDGLCCVEGDQNIYDLVHMYAGRWMKKSLAESNPKYSKYHCGRENETATIKVVGRREKQEKKIGDRKVLWDSDSELAILPEDTYMTHHHEHGFIEIKKPGLYFVYSQLVLEHDGPGRVEEFMEGPVTYQHSVHLTQSGMEQTQSRSILSNKDTRCSCTKDKYRFTSHIGSAFQLHDGDRLFVVVNDVHEVVADPHMNHFGVHRL